MKLAILPMIFASALSAFAQQPDWAADANAMLAGVHEVAAPGSPGTVTVWGAAAFPVVLAGAGGEARVPLVAAARLGSGRIVAFAHDGYGSSANLQHEGTAALMLNAIRWAAGTATAPRVGVVGSDLAGFLTAKELAATRVDANSLPAALAELDVVCIFDSNPGPAAIGALEKFLAAGHGLVAGVTGWGWSQVHGGADVRANPLNCLVAPAGIAWTGDFAEKTSTNGFVAGDVPGPLTHAARAIAALEASALQSTEASAPPPTSQEELILAAATAVAALRALPASASELRDHVQKLARARATKLVPTAEKPLLAADALDRFLLVAQMEAARLLPLESAAGFLPAAAVFPGAVPADAESIERDLVIDTGVPDWHSTGLYAAPGRVVTLSVPPAAINAKLAVRIGCHTDSLVHLAAWPRVPEISHSFTITSENLTVVSPFGGLIYVVVPGGCKLGEINVHVAGAVAAPLYVLGETTQDDWQQARAAPGPWAELATRKVILTVPSAVVRDLDDPKPLMEFWDSILDGAADLATIPRERGRPERYVADVEISAGYMHSGYPIMTHLDAAPRMASLASMQKGDWGLVHELGHNHQVADWTFEGTGEVTNNLWSVYLSRDLCNLTPEQAHEALKDRDARAREFVRAGAPFDKWKRDPFLALTMYLQIQEAFGWELFRTVFAEYRALAAADRPRSDADKRDQWLTRMSRATGKNLGPFFEAWGVPTSAAAREALKELPGWMPEGFSEEN